jgi:hypothetical protein
LGNGEGRNDFGGPIINRRIILTYILRNYSIRE